MTTEKRYLKIIKILKNFKNGEELYKNSAMFNKCIQMMLEGMNVYDVLEQVIQGNERTLRAFDDYIHHCKEPIMYKG